MEGSGGGETPSEPLANVVFRGMRSDQRGKPLVTDAEFEIVSGPRPETWGEQQEREYAELNIVGKLGFWAFLIPTLAAVGWAARTVVGWISAGLGWS